jgi:hypothetical protein
MLKVLLQPGIKAPQQWSCYVVEIRWHYPKSFRGLWKRGTFEVVQWR